MSVGIHFEHIVKKYGDNTIIPDLNLDVKEGEFFTLLGPSGCGKSTLLSLICGLMKPDAGEILLNGIPLKENSPLIGYMLQQDHLLPWRTIWSNILLGPEIQKNLTPDKKEKAMHLLTDYGLLPFKDKHPNELSGGMRQRAALIRTMVMEPELLLLDEPFSALDYQTRLMVSADIGRIIRHSGITAILITHDLSEAISLADRVIVLSKRPGKVVRNLPISLTLPDDSLLAARNAPEFHHYFNILWKEISDEH